MLLTVLLGAAAYRSGLALKRGQVSVNLLLAPLENVARLALVGLCMAIGWGSGLDPQVLGWGLGESVAPLLTGLVAGLALLVVVNLGTTWAVRRFGPDIYSPLVLRNMLPRRGSDWLLAPLALAPAVLLEELLFRSLLVGGFSVLIPIGVAVALSCIAFGMMHVARGVLGAGAATILGAVLAALLWWQESLLTPFVAHYVLNLAQLVVAAVAGNASLDATLGGDG